MQTTDLSDLSDIETTDLAGLSDSSDIEIRIWLVYLILNYGFGWLI